jgi:hypothetical protein
MLLPPPLLLRQLLLFQTKLKICRDINECY